VSEIDPKLSRLYREASSAGPPAAVDAAILAAARKQAAQPRRPARSSWVRWMAPASALATLVVAVSLAFLMQREQPDIDRDMRARPITPLPQSAPPAGVAEPAKAKAAEAARKEAPATIAPVPAPAARSAIPAPALPPAVALPAPAPAAPAPAPPPAEAAAPAAAAFPAERRAKAAAPAMTRESNIASDAALGATGAATPAAPAAAPPAPAAAGKIAPLRQPTAQRSPEAWLAEISRLKREGRDKEAAEQLAEFRKAYPAYAVPEELR